MVIQHNMDAAFTQLQLNVTTDVKRKSSEKLSSGYRINRAADDVASQSMLAQANQSKQGVLKLLQ
ncbi:hypothetical protein [Butyrivibrio fibrisolvens]|uniref:flagellin N-terminal helical domain-containing protein n=1 Tax=Butyrivibrio fibrisolvens TaxID=831 RepID=UPI0003B5C626|nr:hypothetical protein [Butyrivibrio fibrisolvens]